jgi:type VI secretion system secreted protein VgrG
MKAAHPDYPQRLFKQALRLRLPQTPNASGQGWAGMPYTLSADGVPVQQGVLDGSGQLTIDHQVVTRGYQLTLVNGVNYQLPVPTEYRNAEQAHLANRGLHNHPVQTNAEVNTPSAHTDHRALYAIQMDGPNPNKEETEQ